MNFSLQFLDIWWSKIGQRRMSGGVKSLVPRPHPLMRKNGLMNLIKFLGLPCFLQQCNLATFKAFCGNTRQVKQNTKWGWPGNEAIKQESIHCS